MVTHLANILILKKKVSQLDMNLTNVKACILDNRLSHIRWKDLASSHIAIIALCLHPVFRLNRLGDNV